MVAFANTVLRTCYASAIVSARRGGFITARMDDMPRSKYSTRLVAIKKVGSAQASSAELEGAGRGRPTGSRGGKTWQHQELKIEPAPSRTRLMRCGDSRSHLPGSISKLGFLQPALSRGQLVICRAQRKGGKRRFLPRSEIPGFRCVWCPEVSSRQSQSWSASWAALPLSSPQALGHKAGVVVPP